MVPRATGTDRALDAAPVALPQPANRSALAVLLHPDTSTGWIGVMVARLSDATRPRSGEELRTMALERMPELHRLVPIIGARLRALTWFPGSPPDPVIAKSAQNPIPQEHLGRFDLTTEPPLRLVLSPDGSWMTIVMHHAGLDGATGVTIFRMLVGGVPPAPSPPSGPKGRPRFPWDEINRLIHPADPVAPSPRPPGHDVFATADLPPVGRGVATRIPEACLEAACAFSRDRGAPCTRVGITMGIAPSEGLGNRSIYRRVDMVAGANVARAIERALAVTEIPLEIRFPSRALRLVAPLVSRMSDTVVVTNMGRLVLPGIRRFDGYPVARGRSAVTFAAARVSGGESSLTIRARDLTDEDAAGILQDAIERLARG